MQVQHFSKSLFRLVFIFGFVGCVSINLKSPPPEKSKAVLYAPPAAPFQPVETPHVDRSWRAADSGATISYLSDCGNPTDPSLKNIFRGITGEIDDVAVNAENLVEYNGREALHANVEGKVDGVLTRFELMIFKKDGCTYILTYASVAKAFGENQRAFTQFVKEFKVP